MGSAEPVAGTVAIDGHDRGAAWRITLSAVGLFVLSTFGCLAVVATVPALLLGWQPVVLVSGSMTPALRPGDVVVAGPAGDARPGPGTVIVFRSATGATVTHRIVRVNDDGTFTTRGDANHVDDSTPVRPRDVIGVGRLAVPKAGLPSLWVRTGATDDVALFAIVVAGAMALLCLDAGGPPRRRRRTPSSTVVRRLVQQGATAPAVIVVAVAIVAVATPSGSSAALVATTANGPSTFTAGTPTCPIAGTQYTLQASADATVHEDKANANFGTNATIDVKSDNGKNFRAYVTFALPALPAGCSVSAASLTLRTTTFRSGRSIQVARAAGPWTETGLTWNNQPGETGPAIAQPSFNGYMAWSVTTQVQASYTSGNYGLLVRDAAENNPGAMHNKYSSREGATPPVLTMVVG